ncbi:MAG: alpha/beta hydrolase [Clostridia bacterium]|nr:alpha/beta hydrolase [Clostridia bacterium]
MSIIAFFSSLLGFGVKTKANYKEFLDLSYGADSMQTYDLYIPTNKGDTLGLILYIHGGAWTSGDKASYQPAIKNIASKYGYAAASINYRFLSQGVTMTDILSDVNEAVSAIFNKAQAEGFTLGKMITTGMSAGAHLALMYAYNTPANAKIKPVAVGSQCAPTDLSDPNFYADGMVFQNSYLQLVASVVGQNVTNEVIAQFTAQYSPVTYASSAVPTIIAHGQKDNIVPYSNAEILDSALTANGVAHVFITFPNSGHALESDADCAERYMKTFIEYAGEYLD